MGGLLWNDGVTIIFPGIMDFRFQELCKAHGLGD